MLALENKKCGEFLKCFLVKLGTRSEACAIKGGELLIGKLEVYFQFYLFFFELETKFQF